MKRIKPTGCGYNITGQTYTCTPIKKLHPFFAHTYIDAYAAETIRDTGTHTPDQYDNPDWIGDESDLKQGSIDNYVQLPQTFEGFVMTLTPIIDMSGSETGPEVAELDCRVNFDPFTKAPNSVLNSDPDYTAEPDTVNDGFLNLYNNVDPQYLENVYVDAKESTQLIHGSTTQPYYKMTPYLRGRTDYVAGVGYRIVDPNDGVRVPLYAGPGILEPMLDTSFPAIGVDTITSADIIGDFTMWEFNTLSQWQKTVDGRLNALNAKIPVIDYGGIDGLLNLENNKNKKSPCSNFNISIASGLNPLIKRIPPAENPVYSVGGGTILINGATVDVTGIDDVEAPTEIYLDVEPIVEAGVVTGHTASVQAHSSAVFTRAVGHKYVYIGRVAVSNNQDSGLPDFGSGYPFTLYEIQQGECIYYVDMPKEVKNDEYPGPFAVKYKANSDPATPPKLYVTGFDSDGSTDAVYAGKIYIDGVFSKLVPEDDRVTGTSGDFVYAHISLTKSDGVYVYDDCTFSTNPELPDVESGVTVYTVRLARLITDADNKPAVDQIHYGDIYVDADPRSNPATLNYEGPFRVVDDATAATGIKVRGIGGSIDGGDQCAGRIFYDGIEIARPTEGAVTPLSATSPMSVFANITLNADGTTATCKYTTAESTAPNTYNIRLAVIGFVNGALDYIHQIHYGDLYLYGSKQSGGDYNGPFKVSWTFAQQEGHTYVDVSGVDALSTVPQAGFIYMYGAAVAGTNIPITENVDVTNKTDVYIHIYLGEYQSDPTQYRVIDYTINGDGAASSTLPTGATIDYVVKLAHINGNDIYQVQYGDIYIDEQQIIGGSTVNAEYNGPFKVMGGVGLSASTVTLYAFDGSIEDIDRTGKVYNNEADVYPAKCGSPIPVGANSTIYAHVYLTEGTATATYQTYKLSDVAFDTTEGPQVAPPSTVKKIYTYRIARVTRTAGSVEGTYDIAVTQIQHGDIHLGDTSDPIKQKSDASYNGPFRITEEGMDCPICVYMKANNETVYGYFSVNGAPDLHKVTSNSVNIPTGGGTVSYWLNVTPNANGDPVGAITGASNSAANCYNVWLGDLVKTIPSGGAEPTFEIRQMHYGNVQVDGRWT